MGREEEGKEGERLEKDGSQPKQENPGSPTVYQYIVGFKNFFVVIMLFLALLVIHVVKLGLTTS